MSCLVTRNGISEAFRTRWAAHNVRLHRTGRKHFHRPVVGDMHLNFEVMELRADPGLSLLAFSADACSRDDDALRLLANWAATHDPADALKSPTQT
jgi:MmyB-like transcription regulator ligand binding domain